MMAAGGSIVLCASAAARTGLANHEAIAAAKGGVIGLTLSAAATCAPGNIRVNCVVPGLADTPLAARITCNKAALKASRAMHALGTHFLQGVTIGEFRISVRRSGQGPGVWNRLSQR